MAFNRIAHYNVRSGDRKLWGEDKYLLGEPILAPRAADSGENDGYLLDLAYNQETELNELLVLDAADITLGPVARVHLPVRIPSGFHGTWVGA